MERLTQLKSRYDQIKGRENEISDNLVRVRKRYKSLRTELRNAQRARVLIQKCSRETQQELRYQLTELPNLALSTVFDDAYEFQIDFETRRERPEVDFWFVRGGHKILPRGNSGLGAVDIAGMALRICLWSLRNPRDRASIWLDEPFKHLKGVEANYRALSILSEITKPKPEQNWPGLQIVMIADERAPREYIMDIADRVCDFRIRGRKTQVRVLK